MAMDKPHSSSSSRDTAGGCTPLEKEKEGDADVDRISALHDDILLKILNLLDTRTVIRATSALSRRWRHLHHHLPHLLIDVAHFMPRHRHENLQPACADAVSEAMPAYVDAVQRLLSRRRRHENESRVQHLQLSFFLTADLDHHLRSIDRAAEDVVQSGRTECLEFRLWTGVANPCYDDCILHGQRLVSFLQACLGAFRWLTRLFLEKLELGSSCLHHLLSTCDRLQLLSLDMAVTGEDDSILRIDAPSSELLALEIIGCCYERVDLIQVPKLEMLVCKSWYGAGPPLLLGNVPLLHDMSLSSVASDEQTPFRLSHVLSSTRRSLAFLHLNFYDQKIWVEPEDPTHLSSAFSGLRDVYLDNIFFECDLNWTMFVLEAAPALHNLHIKVSRHPCQKTKFKDTAEKVNVCWDQTSSGFKHHHLSLLEIIGFADDEKLTRYIRLVMGHAVNLKRISLLDQGPCAECSAMDNDNVQLAAPPKWRFPTEAEKNVIKQQLVNGFSTSVEVTIG